jgi:hypothetical protein
VVVCCKMWSASTIRTTDGALAHSRHLLLGFIFSLVLLPHNLMLRSTASPAIKSLHKAESPSPTPDRAMDEHVTRSEVLQMFSLNAANVRLEESLARIEAKLSEISDKTSKPDAEVAKPDTELAKRDAELAKRDAELSKRDVELAKRDVELAKRNEELAKRDKDLANLKVAVGALQSDVGTHKARFKNMDSCIFGQPPRTGGLLGQGHQTGGIFGQPPQTRSPFGSPAQTGGTSRSGGASTFGTGPASRHFSPAGTTSLIGAQSSFNPRSENSAIQIENAGTCFAAYGTLRPLLDLTTAQELPGFPRTKEDLDALDRKYSMPRR